MNAGMMEQQSVAKTQAEMVGNIVNLNLVSQMKLTRLLVPSMIEMQRGTLIFMCAIPTYYPFGYHEYTASKAGLASFAQNIGRELAPFGIKVTTLHPGLTAT